MKMVIRADDVGYTKVCNIAAFEALEQGVATAADVMFDTPGTQDALERLRALPADATAVIVLHPGYLDYYVCREGDTGVSAQQFLSIRAVDAHVLCSRELHEWLVANRVELVNFRDALFGTREYQNHLRAVGSDLYVPAG